MRVYLTGFMGSGKSATGEKLAERLGTPFVDLDEQIELRAGLKIREIFERSGEGEFRRLEREALVATGDQPDVVVATGGGTVTFEANARWIRANGVSVWLHPPFAAIVSRIGAMGKEDRPLFRDEAQALALYRERLPAYRRADVTVDVALGEQAEELAARIVLLLAQRGSGS
ncbi:MAG TPA: shikimate kinase [Thermoanaerobaculia bacterium]|nr:shikimate kinase [Thermoanaerobaculia bacterium]